MPGDALPQTHEPISQSAWLAGPSLPQPITNNAVAAIEFDGRTSVFSFLGLDSTKVWSGVTSAAYRWDFGDTAWVEIEPVPGPGRLASTAQVVGGLIYVIGGYTVAENGAERSVPDVNVYDPVALTWSRAVDLPVPVDDAVAGVWAARYVVLVSGWHDTGNVHDVQFYDPEAEAWSASTPIPGHPVFGHTGAVLDNQVIYVDGAAVVDARPRFVIDRAVWRGVISAASPPQLEWTSLAPHPGAPLYRAAAGVVDDHALFIGGTDNPYNYNGIGYDQTPSRPLAQTLAYDGRTGQWGHLSPPPEATMDHRNAPTAGGRIFLVGGMVSDQKVSDHVWYADVSTLLGGGA